MKIRRIKINDIEQRPLLNGLELTFSENDNDSIDPNCFIGVNGSGKSQVLETIAEIFFYLDRIFRRVNRVIVSQSPCLFEIDYSIVYSGQTFEVRVKQDIKKGKSPDFRVYTANFSEVEITLDEIENYLPSKVIGYTSGDNETLSIPFMDYYDEYADHTARRALKPQNDNNPENADYEPRFYLMDYNTNKGVVISNLILGNKQQIDSIFDLISVQSIRNFQLVIQTNHKAAKGKDGIQLTSELKGWIEKLKKIASAFDYNPETNAYTLDFYLSNATTQAFSRYFDNSSLHLYTALYKLELLNNLIIDKKYREEIKRLRRSRRLLIKTPVVPDQDKVLNYSEIKVRLKNGEIVDYINLSDGEHQFINIFGTILMLEQTNAIFLLDEPETHFNPKWRREFVKLWNNITIGRSQDNFITSHSPFIVSDCRKEKVYIFIKGENDKLTVTNPSKETYGSSFDFILKSAFQLDSTLSEKSFDEIKELLESDSAGEIESRLADFGESPEKFYLLKRIEEIKNEESK